MEETNTVHNLFVKLLDGKTLTLKFPSPILSTEALKSHISAATGVPTHRQRLITGVRDLTSTSSEGKTVISVKNEFPTVHLLLRLAGGKGGFGSLLRGAATKAGQKKTNNFEACRDMSGRRLRHVNAERRLEEWRKEEEERRLEKVAEEFLRRQAKKGKKGVGDGEASKYVAKYREVSEKCSADVAESVKVGLMAGNGNGNGNGKRKKDLGVGEGGVGKKKKMKIWMGKRKLNESDSDDSDEDGGEGEEENEKSTVLNNGNDSDSNKAEGSSGSVTGGKQDGESSVAGSSGSSSEEEKDTVPEGKLDSSNGIDIGSLQNITDNAVDPMTCEKMGNGVTMPVLESAEYSSEADKLDSAVAQATNLATSQHVADASKSNDAEADGQHEHKASSHEETRTSASAEETVEPLNFETINSAAELEVLGLERLKSELQARGLKCGGTLQERAARLFLLKSTPLDKLPKKLLAKK